MSHSHGSPAEQAEYAREELAGAMVDDSRVLDAYDESDSAYPHDMVGSEGNDEIIEGGHDHDEIMVDDDEVIGEENSYSHNPATTDMDESDPARLFSILEEVMPRYEEASPQGNMSGSELQQKREMAEQTWDQVRKWMWANSMPEQRQAAAYVRGTADATALHLMCKLHHPPVDVISAMVEAAPEIVSWTDSHGWLPLHHASANGANPDVMKVLIEAYPEGKVVQDNMKRTPLHFYATRNADNPSSMMENALLLSDSGAAELTDKGGMLPMHYASAYGTDAVVLQVLAEVFPESLTARENKGRTVSTLAWPVLHGMVAR